MVSEKITVGLATKDLKALHDFLSGKGIKCRSCSKIGAGGEKYFVVGPMDGSYLQPPKKREFIEKYSIEEYVLLGPGEGNLDEIANYREEHGCE